MAYNRLVGLEKGNCAFLGCFRVSAAGGFMYTRARVRASGSVGLSFLFRKQNKVGSDTLTSLENKTRVFRSVVFFSVVGWVLSLLLSKKRQTVAGCPVYVYVHTRARWLRSFSFGLFLSEKTLFSFSFFLYIFLSSFSFFCKSIILFFLSLS